MSNDESKAVTRRAALRRLALLPVLGQMGCLNDCAELPVLRLLALMFWGQAASEAVTAYDLDEDDLRDHYYRKQFQRSTGRQRMRPEGRPAPGPISGVAAGSAGGPTPPGAAPLTQARRGSSLQDAGFRRAFYLLDTLGDANTDGRVYAFDVDENRAALRGQVGLRPIDSAAPFIDLEHIALSQDGASIVVSQQGAPSQWIFIDAASLTITGRLLAPAGQLARRALFSPDGKVVFLVAGTNTSTVPPAALHVADASSHQILETVELPPNTVIQDLAVTPDQGLLFCAGRQFIHVVDVRSATYGAAVVAGRTAADPLGPLAARLDRILMGPLGSLFYTGLVEFTDEGRQAVAVFDTQSVRMVGDITVRERPTVGSPLMALSPSGATLYYAVQLGSAIQLLDTETGTEAASVAVDAAFRLTALSVA